MAEEGAAGVAEEAGSGIGKLVTWMLVAVFGFAGYAQPGWPFSFKDIAAKILGWLGIGGAGANISTGDIANLIAGGICGALGGVTFAWGIKRDKIMGAVGMVGGAWLLGKAVRHVLAGVGVK